MAETRQIQAANPNPLPKPVEAQSRPRREPETPARPQAQAGVRVEISARARAALAAQAPVRVVVQAARTTGQVRESRIPPPPVRIGRFEAAPPRPRLPVAVIRNPLPPPRPPRPLPAVRLETEAPRLEQVVRARARAAGLPERVGRVEDRVFAERAVRNQDSDTDALIRALEQRALAVTVGPGGNLRAPGAVQPTILDVAR